VQELVYFKNDGLVIEACGKTPEWNACASLSDYFSLYIADFHLI
jgi:hypothetical protein